MIHDHHLSSSPFLLQITAESFSDGSESAQTQRMLIMAFNLYSMEIILHPFHQEMVMAIHEVLIQEEKECQIYSGADGDDD